MEKEGRNIQSVERAFNIIEYISMNPRGVNLTKISKKLGLNKSTTFGLVSTLENLNCVRQENETKKYFLGVKLLEFGQSIMKNLDVIQVAKPYIRELAAKYDETVNLALLSGENVIYLDTVKSGKSVRVEIQLNEKVPAYACSTGKVMLAYMDKERRNELIKKIDFEKRTVYTISNFEQLYAELNNVAKVGYAFDREEFEIGLTCISAPVFDTMGNASAAISLNAPTIRMTQINQEELIYDIVSIAKQLSNKLKDYGIA